MQLVPRLGPIVWSESRRMLMFWPASSKVVFGKLPVLGHPTQLGTIEQGPTALAIGVGRVCGHFFLSSFFASFSLSGS